eukprot:1179373-Prorocentrum_minimum.AAC.5
MTFCEQGSIVEGPGINKPEATSEGYSIQPKDNEREPQTSPMPQRDELGPTNGGSDLHTRETTAAVGKLDGSAPQTSLQAPYGACVDTGCVPSVPHPGSDGELEASGTGAPGDVEMEDAMPIPGTGPQECQAHAQDFGQSGTIPGTLTPNAQVPRHERDLK